MDKIDAPDREKEHQKLNLKPQLKADMMYLHVEVYQKLMVINTFY